MAPLLSLVVGHFATVPRHPLERHALAAALCGLAAKRSLVAEAGALWQDRRLDFASVVGSLWTHNVRCWFRAITRAARAGRGLDAEGLRHIFISLLSAHDVTLEDIARLIGNSGTSVAERVYRHEIRPSPGSVRRDYGSALSVGLRPADHRQVTEPPCQSPSCYSLLRTFGGQLQPARIPFATRDARCVCTRGQGGGTL
jgi:hypothetical protein